MEILTSLLHAQANNLPMIVKSLGPIGLIALADLQTVAERTALTGGCSLLDTLALAPGLHRQCNAPDLHKGEYPACAAMTTGYVFRVENPATVLYLQRVAKPGHLTTLAVGPGAARENMLTMLSYNACVLLTLSVIGFVFSLRDIVSTQVIALLVMSRLVNVLIIRRRAKAGWHGAPEPGVQSDLLVLLSQDRWVRIQGPTDDVKAVTSGTWLRDPTWAETLSVRVATLLAWLSAPLSAEATRAGKLALLILFLGNAMFLEIANKYTKDMTMFGRTLSVNHSPKPYSRRLELTEELVKEFKRTDCFVAMGMIQPDKEKEFQRSYKGAVIT